MDFATGDNGVGMACMIRDGLGVERRYKGEQSLIGTLFMLGIA